MSSTSTRFQTPAHTLVHMDRYHEMGSQQSYSDDRLGSLLGDYGFPANDNTYTTRAEDLYEEAQYSGLSPRTGRFDYEDDATPGVARYDDRMHDMNVNYTSTSPQLLCPRPTLPLQPPQFSWSNWPSEAPIDANRTYSEPGSQQHANSMPHSPEATDIQYSYENQQALHSPTFYPAAQEFVDPASDGPMSTSRYHENSGYVHQPLVSESSSSFGRGPTQSTHSMGIQHRYHAAHQPIRPEQHSSYSELAPNLTFMNSQAKPPPVRKETIYTQDHHIPKDPRKITITRIKTPPVDIKKNPYALGLNGPPLTAIGRKVTPPPPIISDRPVENTTAPSTVFRTRSSRSVNEPRRPSLACTFCRERKIACGRPPDGSTDLTCNQCARRSFRCRYLESKSAAPSVRSRANSKDASPPLKRK